MIAYFSTSSSDVILFCSIFENGPIPYPKREFLTDDETEDKMDTAASKVATATVKTFKLVIYCFCNVLSELLY